ncbi:type II toxin-antitoxin system VapC family toxin [Cellulomonas pakistanensis]|uniref:Ribonuclease VapC n=1 Tax=Cellulomonas pakistanensis TaxID=992287 RepID=A0A919P9X8_9CELL|nr:type II toxin-antitoxin system VapC family toxin [Cellulomonas pakistanensis]GIG36328.1 ribonuclease VapC [Cellulomonas pakistanensis]
MALYYYDTSALAKLVVAEAESAALRAVMLEAVNVSSDLARTELVRAVRRAVPDRVPLAHDVLTALDLVALTPEVMDAAGRLGPDALRSPDAVHVAAALTLGDELDALVTYDDRMAEAATRTGLHVLAPGRD